MTSAAVHDVGEMRDVGDGQVHVGRESGSPGPLNPDQLYGSAGCLLYSASCVCNHSMLIGDTRMLSAPNGIVGIIDKNFATKSRH